MQAGTDGLVTWEDVDSADLVYMYEGVFDYGRFLEDISEVIPEYIDVPSEEDFAGEGGADTVFLDMDEERTYDVHDLFRRMGIDRLDGAGNFVYLKPLTYLETTGTTNQSTEEYDVGLPLRLKGMLAILPLSVDADLDGLTAIL